MLQFHVQTDLLTISWETIPPELGDLIVRPCMQPPLAKPPKITSFLHPKFLKMSLKYIDSHVHLFSKQDALKLAWMDKSNLLYGDHTLQQYSEEWGTQVYLEGIVFVEVDRISSFSRDGWKEPIEEYKYLSSVKKTETKYSQLLKGFVLWAPIGSPELNVYLQQLKAADEEYFGLVKGFRYLLQDKPSGSMLQESFINGLRLLCSHKYLFEIGINVRSAGLWQLTEAVEMVKKVPDMTFVVDHLTKPDFDLSPSDSRFQRWKAGMEQLSQFKVFLKISGFFSELPPDSYKDIDKCVEQVVPWVQAVLDLFTVDRILWGSDWPVCKFGAGSEALKHWQNLTDKMMKKLKFSDSDKRKFLSANSCTVYKLSV